MTVLACFQRDRDGFGFIVLPRDEASVQEARKLVAEGSRENPITTKIHISEDSPVAGELTVAGVARLRVDRTRDRVTGGGPAPSLVTREVI